MKITIELPEGGEPVSFECHRTVAAFFQAQGNSMAVELWQSHQGSTSDVLHTMRLCARLLEQESKTFRELGKQTTQIIDESMEAVEIARRLIGGSGPAAQG